jgi:site-specific DNA recombinase
MSKKAILYARISGMESSYKTPGIEAQLQQCRKYAGERGYTIVEEIFEEPNKNTSGAEWLPGINRVMELAAEKAFDVLVVRELDRLSRDIYKHLQIKHHLEHYDITIDYVLHDFSGREGEFLETTLSGFASWFSKDVSRKMHKGIRDSVRNGSIKTGGCGAPYGYDLEEVDGRHVLVINEYEAEIVRQIFDMYVNQRETIYGIRQYLDKHNIPKPLKGKAHKANQSKARDLGWSGGTIRGILTNETYTGRWYYRKTRNVKHPVTGKVKHVPRPRSEWLMVKVPRIVSDNLFSAVTERRQKNKKVKGKQHVNTYTLGGLVTCGRCGKAMSGIVARSDSRRYSYYTCNSKRDRKRYGYKCDNRYVRTDKADPLIWRWLSSILLDPAQLANAYEQHNQDRLTQARPFLNMLNANEKKLTDMHEKKQRLIDAYAAGVLTLDDIAAQKTELEKRINDTEQAVKQLRRDVDQQMPSPSDLATIESFAERVREGANAANADPEKQREIYDLLDLSVTFDVVDGQQVADVKCILGQVLLSPDNCTAPNSGPANVKREAMRRRQPNSYFHTNHDV